MYCNVVIILHWVNEMHISICLSVDTVQNYLLDAYLNNIAKVDNRIWELVVIL